MTKGKLAIALKEWAVVQHSLLIQHQIILIRKGGIAEDTGDFDLRAEEFLLMPTYLHETERSGDVQPCFQQWLQEEENRRPGASDVCFECACVVNDVLRIDDRERLVKMMPQHIWSRQFIDGRFDWEPYKPVTVLLVRAYRLDEPVFVPFARSFGGCRSWVTLDEPISTQGARPAISNNCNFERRMSIARDMLCEPLTL